MEVLGYSERGIVNTLAHDIGYRPNGDALFHGLLCCARFPLTDSRPCQGPVELIVEPSFSDFGDADAVALIGDDVVGRCSIFVEAKVQTVKVGDWKISDEFGRFQAGLQGRVKSSNLFAQLYHKYRLARVLVHDAGRAALKEGIPFPSWSTTRVRKIGSNSVVGEVVDRITPFLNHTFFLAIVPDRKERVGPFFEKTLKPFRWDSLEPWDVTHFGYLTWCDVEQYCRDVGLDRTLKVFELNRRQIYASPLVQNDPRVDT